MHGKFTKGAAAEEVFAHVHGLKGQKLFIAAITRIMGKTHSRLVLKDLDSAFVGGRVADLHSY